ENMTKSKEDAVSPVIGVIQMVAVTVILAAVITAFVFGMESNVGGCKVVAITAARDASAANTVILTYQGGTDSNKVVSFAVLQNGQAVPASNVTAPSGGDTSAWKPDVGSTITFKTDDTAAAAHPGMDKITVVGTFTDGKDQIVL